MNYVSFCPTSIVNAPVELVWMLLTRPEAWLVISSQHGALQPSILPGSAVVGQTVFAESGPRFLHLKLQASALTEIGLAESTSLDSDARFPAWYHGAGGHELRSSRTESMPRELSLWLWVPHRMAWRARALSHSPPARLRPGGLAGPPAASSRRNFMLSQLRSGSCCRLKTRG